MSDLYFLEYNNYYNRLLLREETLAAYLPFMIGTTPIQNVNFIPANGINTQYIANWSYEATPDYLLVVEDGEIISRWFVLDSDRTRSGQYRLALRRDLLADFYNPLINATAFIEKATLEYNDPLIFNKESMTFNQIKTSETLLKDESQCPWIVGYYARTTANDTLTSLSGTAEIYQPSDILLDGPYYTWQYSNKIGTSLETGLPVINTDFSQQTIAVVAKATTQNANIAYKYYHRNSLAYLDLNSSHNGSSLSTTYPSNSVAARETAFSNACLEYYDQIGNQIPAYYKVTPTNNSEYNTLLSQVGKRIETTEADGTHKYYKVKLYSKKNTSDSNNIAAGSLYNTLESVKQSYNNKVTSSNMIIGNANQYSYWLEYNYTETILIAEEVTNNETVSYNIGTTRYVVADAPYDIFCMPYSNSLVIKNSGSDNADIIASENIAFGVANAIGEKYKGGGVLYDIQLLPYCPVRNLIVSNNTIDLLDDNKAYSYITDSDNKKVGVILNCNVSSFQLDIPLTNPIVINNPKIESQTDMYRLCSPNYNGVFEFNAAKNLGVSRFNVDCTYLPFNPYIHVNPDFKGLYGQDFNDNRGLIVGGDFSLAIVTDQWETYKLQNKNYEQIFNRQIKNMEVNNAVQREREIWGVATGALNAGIGGAMTGALVSGSPFGALAGLATAGISAAAGARDIQLADRLRAESLDYTKDLFGYNLGNIQALPDGLAKTTAYTANNKIFPFLEYYTCTQEEKQALADKIKYNGMTVMRIGKIADYIRSEPTYIKGKLIRVSEIGEDFNVINELANEFNKGAFI